MELKGVPPEYILDISTRKNIFFEGNNQPIIKPNSRGKKRLPSSKDIVQILGCDDMAFVNFVEVC